MLFEADITGRAHWPMPIYFAARMLTREWAQPVNQPHSLYAASSDIRDHRGRQIVTAYAVRRPDQKWSVLLVKKDSCMHIPLKSHSAAMHLSPDFDEHVGGLPILSPAICLEGVRNAGYPVPTEPPQRFRVINSQVTLPPFSLTVARGLGHRSWSRPSSLTPPVRCTDRGVNGSEDMSAMGHLPTRLSPVGRLKRTLKQTSENTRMNDQPVGLIGRSGL